MRLPIALVLAVATGCGAESGTCPEVANGCDATVRGACVQLGDTGLDAAVVAAQVDHEIVAGAAYWNADPDRVLAGWVIRLSAHSIDDPENPPYGVNGLCWANCGVIEIWALYPGCSATFLEHELGHVVIGDGEHTDPRWASVPKPTRC